MPPRAPAPRRLAAARSTAALALVALALCCLLGVLLLAASLLATAAHGETTAHAPVNLGAAGLCPSTPGDPIAAADCTGLAIRVWHWDGTAAAPTAASTAAVTITDLGTGEYVLAGLPDATGDNAYSVLIALAASDEAALAEYAYGARPGTSIVWRQELAPSPQPWVFKQHDTYGTVSLTVLRRLPAAICQPGTTYTFALWSVSAGAAVLSGATATCSNRTEDDTTGTYGATLTYDWSTDDGAGLATAGDFLAEWTVCYSPTSCHTLPADNRLQIRVVEDFDGE